MIKLSDGRVAFRGPDCHGYVPEWIKSLLPPKHDIVRRGGTTYQWSGWISQYAPFVLKTINGKIVGRCVTQAEADHAADINKKYMNRTLIVVNESLDQLEAVDC